ncbi:GNAT family N-acetyltransferase [Luteimonas aquatica]|uniref:GNAT family N-acetyltransferase n=1 Tax=Luteimonas aquatica TaxID=450364 RepID=UPI001F5A2B1A|nr:GNAT family N-acetyltransferase [Luteimonas aquatica]
MQRHPIDIADNIRLRPWRIEDLDALVRHADDAQVSRGVSDRFPSPYTRADGESFLAGRVIDLEHPVFAIEIDGEASGGIGVHPGRGERRASAEFGYWLGRAWWGRGLMTRIVGVFAPWAMRELRLHRLQAGVLDFNIGSARVLLKNGFVEEGTQRCAVLKRERLHDLRIFAKTRTRLDGEEVADAS